MIITHVFPRIFKLIEWRDSLRILKSRTSRTTRRTDSGAAFLLLEVLIVNTMRYGAIARRSITFRKDNRNFLFDGEDHSLRGKKRRELYRHWSWFINWWFNKIVSLDAECFLTWNSVWKSKPLLTKYRANLHKYSMTNQTMHPNSNENHGWTCARWYNRYLAISSLFVAFNCQSNQVCFFRHVPSSQFFQ